MISDARDFVQRNPLIPLISAGLVCITGIEWIVASHSVALFEFLFVMQGQLTLGIILAPFSHGSISHLAVNIGLLLLFGWVSEAAMSRKEFLIYFLLVAYASTVSQVVVSVVTTGDAGTLGVSGAAYSFPGFYGVWGFLRARRENKPVLTETFVLSSVIVSLLIPFVLIGVIDIVPQSGTPPAKVTHSVGFALGLAYGFLKAN